MGWFRSRSRMPVCSVRSLASILGQIRGPGGAAVRPRGNRIRQNGALFLFARQKYLERPLDRAGACTRKALAAIRPGLRSLEVGVAPHECAAVLRLILTIARLP